MDVTKRGKEAAPDDPVPSRSSVIQLEFGLDFHLPGGYRLPNRKSPVLEFILLLQISWFLELLPCYRGYIMETFPSIEIVQRSASRLAERRAEPYGSQRLARRFASLLAEQGRWSRPAWLALPPAGGSKLTPAAQLGDRLFFTCCSFPTRSAAEMVGLRP
jgi:hypothetical protein